MQVNPYLQYNGNCEAAFKFYEKAVGGKIEVLMTHETAPPEMPMPPEWKKKIMHGRDLDRRRDDDGHRIRRPVISSSRRGFRSR